MSTQQNSILIIGAGTMGLGIAKVFLGQGYSVALSDFKAKLAEIKNAFNGNELIRLIESNNLYPGQFDNLELVIEAVNEDFAVKAEIFRKLDKILDKDVIFASNTSTMSVTKLAKETSRADRFIGLHFFNPAQKMKLVEIVKGERTSEETVAAVQRICSQIGKSTVVLKDTPGFIVNRLLFVMLNEAFYLSYNNTAENAVIDKAMKLGAMHPMGPLALADLIGLDVCYSILSSLEDSLVDAKYRPCPILNEKINRNELGRKTGQGFYNYARINKETEDQA